MWDTIKIKVQEGWKAIVALVIPILFGLAVTFVEELQAAVEASGSVWTGVAVGVLSAVGVWLKANRPAS